MGFFHVEWIGIEKKSFICSFMMKRIPTACINSYISKQVNICSGHKATPSNTLACPHAAKEVDVVLFVFQYVCSFCISGCRVFVDSNEGQLWCH